MTEGTPIHGDRSAWQTVGFPQEHAEDIYNGTPVHHTPHGATIGELLYWNGSKWIVLPDVAVASYLRSGGVGVAPLWSTLKLPNAATQGDILHATSANTIGNLAAVAVGSYLRSNGAGAVSVWSTLKLPNAATLGDLLYASGANTIGNLADVAAGQILLSGGVGAAPGYAAFDWDTVGGAAGADMVHDHSAVGEGGKLAQANTHESPDTDAATTSLHHTIGSGATQAAAGNHTHMEIVCIDDAVVCIDDEVVFYP